LFRERAAASSHVLPLLRRPESLQRQDLLEVTRAKQLSLGTKTMGSGSAPTNGLETGKN
jgi:hypothetical protein